MMETKKKSLGLNKSFTSTEKRCHKCGFVTFCLRVLYTHKYKCRGKLLGSLVCCYCKRKFNYLSLYKQHKKNCVKSTRKKKVLVRKHSKSTVIKRCKKGFERTAISSTKSRKIVCPDCSTCFTSKDQYDSHVKEASCYLKKSLKKIPKQNFSARKSFSKVHPEPSQTNELLYEYEDSHINASYEPFIKYPKNSKFESRPINSGLSCTVCDNIFLTKDLLLNHLKKNYECAINYYQPNSVKPVTKISFKARKSFGTKLPVVARKSFSHFNHNKASPSFNYASSGGSARKSLPGAYKRSLKNARSSVFSPAKVFNQCPVCYEMFPDSFNFFQHQKRYNHWGKATKSMNNICKCPFCEKQFYHVRARNAHLRNHADRSDKEINMFLKNSTCNICSQIFVSETAKYQHVKIEHPKTMLDSNPRESHNNKQSLLPLVIKQKLKEYPNTCPICSKDFPTTFHRNKHLQKKHLDSELECKFCSQRYNSVDNLEHHMQKAHYNSFKFECLACKIYLATAPHVVLHVTKLHPNQDPKKIIRNRDNELALLSEHSLDSANESKNASEKGNQGKTSDFYCDVCGISFMKLCGLQSHRQSKSHRDMLMKNLDDMQRSLVDLPPSPQALKKQVKQPEILTCNDCSEEFTSVKDFVPHRLSHFSVHGKYLKISDENLYNCEICGEISDSHSKVQMHLFWHLQVESTSNEKNSKKTAGKNGPIVPDRLSGQHVAKKSFSKQSPESHQEVVIGGVKKPLFTCESCNVGFTTQAHYSLHVRKFCRVKHSSQKSNFKGEEAGKSPVKEVSSNKLPDIKTLGKHALNVENSNLEHCSKCNCLFSSSIEEIHESFCKKCAVSGTEHDETANQINSNMDLQSVVAACITCALPFDNPKVFSEHMLACHKSAANSVSVKTEDNNSKTTVHCTACNCLFFSSSAIENHDTFCSNSSYCDFDSDSVAEIMKAASTLGNLLAACISCSVAFDNVQHLNEHMLLHKDSVSSDTADHIKAEGTLNGPQGLSGNEITIKCVESLSTNTDTAISFDNLEPVSSTTEDDALHKPAESLDFPSESMWADPDSSKADQSFDSDVSDAEKELTKPIYELRDNFSQLLCILINDTELMQHLGYGKQPVDDVLVKVLQQMGQEPVLKDGQITDIDCLRKNIRILLDFCLKDQIMELIGSGKTSTDEIVIEALKTFSSEKNAVTAE